jgi:hypothetical protein
MGGFRSCGELVGLDGGGNGRLVGLDGSDGGCRASW